MFQPPRVRLFSLVVVVALAAVDFWAIGIILRASMIGRIPESQFAFLFLGNVLALAGWLGWLELGRRGRIGPRLVGFTTGVLCGGFLQGIVGVEILEFSGWVVRPLVPLLTGGTNRFTWPSEIAVLSILTLLQSAPALLVGLVGAVAAQRLGIAVVRERGDVVHGGPEHAETP